VKILLTGCSGFLGSALAMHFYHTGHAIALLIRPFSRLDRLRGIEKNFEIERCQIDKEIIDFINRY
jgi:CDP-paratose synthetase